MSTVKAPIATQEDLEYLRSIGTGVIDDALERLSLRGGSARLKPTKTFSGKHIAGPAVTVRYLPSRGQGDKSVTSMYEVMRKAGKGTVVVVEGQGFEGHFFGGNMAHQSKRAGVEAVVIDGGFRDTEEILGYDIALFSSQGAVVASATSGAMVLAALDVPISCNGIQVRPGDIVVGDDDGVVFIPSEAYASVMANVRDIDVLEQQMERVIASDEPFEELKVLLASKKQGKV